MAKHSKLSQSKKPHTKRGDIATQPKRRPSRFWFAAVVLAASIALIYGRAISTPFIFDDDISIVKNSSILSLWPPVGTTEHPGPLNPPPDNPTSARPLVNLSFALNYRFGGLHPVGYHVVNVLLHFGSAMLLWAIVRRTLQLPYFGNRFETSAEWLALAAALLWALHPLQTEAVNYVSQRTELMMAFFYLATLYGCLRYWEASPIGPDDTDQNAERNAEARPSKRGLWLIMSTVSCLAGMASKEVMVSAPLIALLFERTFITGSIAKSLRRSWPLYLGLASTWVLLFALTVSNQRSNSAGFGLGVPAITWWLTQSKVLVMYLKLLVWPWPQLIHYELPYLETFADALLYVIPVLLLGITTLVLLWRNHPIGFLGTFMFAILSPTFVVPILTEMAAERRMYLPLAALFTLFVVGGYFAVQKFAGHRAGAPKAKVRSDVSLAAIAVPSLLLAITFGLVSANRLDAYHNELTLWQDVLRFQPRNVVAHQNAGLGLDKAGNSAAAIEHFREAVRLDPESAQSHYSLAVLLTKTGAHDEAASHFAAASRITPNDLRARVNLAAALFVAGRYDESIEASRAALELAPNDWAVYNNLGLALQKAGKHQEAVERLEQALRLNPTALDIYNDIADTYLLANQQGEVIATLERGLKVARSAGNAEYIEKFTHRLTAVPKN